MIQMIAALRRRLFPPTETLDGYDQPELIDIVFQKTLIYVPADDWPEMEGVSAVLDFGGACGVHYKRATRQSANIRWAVVETAAMVERAASLETDRLRFFTSIPDAACWLGDVDVMYSNSALQYTPDPEQALTQLCDLRARRMIWERLILSAHSTEREVQSSLLGDNGPGKLPNLKEKTIRCVRTKIPEQTFLNAHEGYSLVDRGTNWFRFVR
jgi:hypothetical protein